MELRILEHLSQHLVAKALHLAVSSNGTVFPLIFEQSQVLSSSNPNSGPGSNSTTDVQLYTVTIFAPHSASIARKVVKLNHRSQ